MEKALEYFAKGGPVMWPLLVASVFALGVFLERLISLRTSRVCPPALLAEVIALCRADKRAEAIGRCVGSTSSTGAIFAALLRAEPAQRTAAAEETGRREAQRVERFVEAIGVVAALGPLLGLLGTVLGMIEVFQRVNEVGAGSPVEMAAGIWEALVATAFGLVVGIPALVMYRLALARVDAVVARMEEDASTLRDALAEQGRP